MNCKIDALAMPASAPTVPGEELKTDLAKIAAHWDSMSDEIKATGSMNYAAYPPRNPELLTYRLWDKHVGEGWKEHAETPIENTPEIRASVMQQLRPMIDAIEKMKRGQQK
jgi:L-rhamnose mutarotase